MTIWSLGQTFVVQLVTQESMWLNDPPTQQSWFFGNIFKTSMNSLFSVTSTHSFTFKAAIFHCIFCVRPLPWSVEVIKYFTTAFLNQASFLGADLYFATAD